ncbi:MAG: hypothetical protein M1826_000074 [Phylliscum demangeonii]|nr:MAG: hypothetical protein M1826_000074 [Phylliscum demangeonii]
MVDRLRKPAAIPLSPSFPVPRVDFSDDHGRLKATLVTGESIEVLLYGATIISWTTHGREHLFLSDAAHLDGSKPVRGGIPLVFPVFGPPPAQGATARLAQHGFARSSRWEFLNRSTSESASKAGRAPGDSSVTLDFGLSASQLTAEARQAWPYDFALIYSVTLGRDGLETSIQVRNEGREPFDFQVLLHTYLRVEDIAKTTVAGLHDVRYVDKVRAGPAAPKEETESNAVVAIRGETDRVYQSVAVDRPVTVLEQGQARFEIRRDNLSDVVVWNPGPDKAAAMADLRPDDAWTHLLCIEAGAVAGWQKLDPGDTFEGGQTIKPFV